VDIFLDCRKVYPTAGLKGPEGDAAAAEGKVSVNLARANGTLPLYIPPAFREEAALRRAEEAAAAVAAGEGLMVSVGSGSSSPISQSAKRPLTVYPPSLPARRYSALARFLAAEAVAEG